MIIETGFSAAILAGSYMATRLVGRWLVSYGERRKAAPQRAFYIGKVFDLGLVVLAVLAIFLVWGIDSRSVFLFASSLLAVLGIAFVAQWSILSNITASIVIFFCYRARLGDRVKVFDSAASGIEGVIVDINLFQVVLQDDDGNTIHYPNNLFIQKPVIIMLLRPAEGSSLTSGTSSQAGTGTA